jgi:hypothetical protein
MTRFVKIAAVAAALSALLVLPASANDVVAALLKQYEKQGASRFAAASAQAMWTKSFEQPKSGEKRQCSTCHSEDLRRPGKHATTGKRIEPLAPSVNPKRLTDAEHIEKWFLRNCKWTLDRECTPQEKGDFLMMIVAR